MNAFEYLFSARSELPDGFRMNWPLEEIDPRCGRCTTTLHIRSFQYPML